MFILVFSIIAAVILLVGLAVVLYVFVFSKAKIRKAIKELQRKYSYLNALLIGQDSQYIHRLEIISNTNLFYVDKYEEFSRIFKEVYENNDKYVASYLKQLNTLVNSNQYKNIKVIINDATEALNIFESEVTKLDHDLYELIKLEEDSRQAILKYKEDFRRIKQLYYNASNSLELIAPSLNKIFKKLEDCFAEYDAHIDGAEYDDAKNLIPTISEILNAVDHLLVTAPDLCLLVKEVVPASIATLTSEYEQALKEKIPLYHLCFKDTVKKWKQTLEHLKTELLSLHTSTVKAKVNEIQTSIETIRELIKSERADKENFDVKLASVYGASIELERNFIKICSLLPQIKEFYVFSEEKEKVLETLRTSINNLSAARNMLDTFIHSNVEQPYSILTEKLDVLVDEYNSSKAQVDDFKSFIDSLKTYSVEAYNLIYIYFYRAKQIENLVRNVALEKFTEMYEEKVNACYSMINDIYLALKTKPINVEELNVKVEQLKSYCGTLFEEIETKFSDCRLAESAIVYANRDRQQSDVNQQLSTLENLFADCEFAKTYNDARNIYHQSHVENGDGK